MKSNWITLYKDKALILVSQESVSGFLGYYYQMTKKYWPPFSYSSLAKEMGVSKSLILGIFKGTKKLTPKTLGPLLKALKLPGSLEEYFSVLADDSLSKKRFKILKDLRESFVDSYDQSLNLNTSISDPDFAILYAALGDQENGASIEEIALKINWSEERIRFLLHELQLKKFVKIINDTRWKGTRKFISTVANKQNDWLPKLFHSSVERHQKMAKKNFFSEDHLSLTYTFCVKDNDWVALNEELKTVISQMMRKYHDGQGEKIVSLILGTHTN